MGSAVGPRGAGRAVRTRGLTDRAEAAVGALVRAPATAQRVLHPFTGLAHPGSDLIDRAFLAKSPITSRLGEPLLRATCEAVELVLAFRIALMGAVFPLRSEWNLAAR